jgi:O2-independent ubiquinone biosynthesis accessory factor UbiT
MALWLAALAGRLALPTTLDPLAGGLAALLGLVYGAFDGDALFFSRDLVVEGDTGAMLALRNAIDNAEFDLAVEFPRPSGRSRR